jgi:starch synthase
MKIAFLTSEYPHPKVSFSAGIGTSIKNLSKGLVSQGHQVTVFIYGQNQDEKFVDDGISFYKIKNKKLKGFSRILTQQKIQNILNSLIAKGDVDIVEATDWTGITSRIKLKCPLVVKLHGSDTYFCHLDNRPVKRLNKLREKKALENSKAVLSVSQYTANVTKELFSLKSDITVIPNCIDIKEFSLNEANHIQENTILYFGTLIRKKGLLELPLIFNKIYERNKNVKLILIGKDAYDVVSGNPSTWEMMQSLFDKEVLNNVAYLGSVPYEEIRNHIGEATVCVFPTFAEALPVSWIEAMAMQKAIVASNIGWASEVIEDNVDGFLVHPKEHILFADKILELLDNSNLRNQFGINARKKVEDKFGIKVIANQTINFYNKVIQK